MLMGVFPGFSGQKFIEAVLDKIVELKKIIGNRNILIEFTTIQESMHYDERSCMMQWQSHMPQLRPKAHGSA